MDRLTNNTEMDTYQSLSHWIIQQSKKKKKFQFVLHIICTDPATLADGCIILCVFLQYNKIAWPSLHISLNVAFMLHEVIQYTESC